MVWHDGLTTEAELMFLQSPAYKKRKQMDKHDHDDWKSAVLKSNKLGKAEGSDE